MVYYKHAEYTPPDSSDFYRGVTIGYPADSDNDDCTHGYIDYIDTIGVTKLTKRTKNMQAVNIKNNKYCLNCRFWAGPLAPKINAPGIFNVDASQKSICYKTHVERIWNYNCDKWAIKQELE